MNAFIRSTLTKPSTWRKAPSRRGRRKETSWLPRRGSGKTKRGGNGTWTSSKEPRNCKSLIVLLDRNLNAPKNPPKCRKDCFSILSKCGISKCFNFFRQNAPCCSRRKMEEEEKNLERKMSAEKALKIERRMEREARRRNAKTKRKNQTQEEAMAEKIAVEERKLVIAQRKLESIRILDELLDRVKVISTSFFVAKTGDLGTRPDLAQAKYWTRSGRVSRRPAWCFPLCRQTLAKPG